MPAVIVIGLLAAIFIGYGCAALARKVRLRSTATALEGEYFDEGVASTGSHHRPRICGPHRSRAEVVSHARRIERPLRSRSVPSGCRLLRRMARLESREGPSSQTRARVFSCDVSGLRPADGRTAQRSLAMADSRFERSPVVLRDADGREDQEDRRRGRARLNDLDWNREQCVAPSAHDQSAEAIGVRRWRVSGHWRAEG